MTSKQEKQSKIPETLLYKLFRYFLCDDDRVYEDIKKELEIKLEAMIKHELYTKSKTADTAEEREKTRQQYLDMVGMHKDFRW